MRNAIGIISRQRLSREKSGKCLVKCDEILCVLATLRLVLGDGYFLGICQIPHNSDLRLTRGTSLPNPGSQARASRLPSMIKSCAGND